MFTCKRVPHYCADTLPAGITGGFMTAMTFIKRDKMSILASRLTITGLRRLTQAIRRMRGMSTSTTAMTISTTRRAVVMCGVCAAERNDVYV